MSAIHGAIWFFIGVFIWVYSAFISSRTGETYAFFTWIAAGFILWGAIRLTIQYWPKKRARKPLVGPPHKAVHKHTPPGQHSHSHKHVQHHHSSPHQTHTHVRSGFRQCSHCHHTISVQAHVCPHCRASQ